MFNIFNDLTNVSNLVGTGLVVISGGIAVSQYILPYIDISLETLSYAVNVPMLLNKFWVPYFYQMSDESTFSLSLPSQILLPLTVIYSFENAGINIEKYSTQIFGLTTLFWTMQTIIYESKFIATLSVMSFLGLLGSGINISWRTIEIGVKNDSLYTTFIGAGLMVVLYRYLDLNSLLPSKYLDLYRVGIYSIAMFYHYIAGIILSSRYYHGCFNFKYLITNLIVASTLFTGYASKASNISNTGTVVGFMYLIEKYYDIPWNNYIHLASFSLGLGLLCMPVYMREILNYSFMGIQNY
jgi:hypothetical protein